MINCNEYTRIDVLAHAHQNKSFELIPFGFESTDSDSIWICEMFLNRVQHPETNINRLTMTAAMRETGTYFAAWVHKDFEFNKRRPIFLKSLCVVSAKFITPNTSIVFRILCFTES